MVGFCAEGDAEGDVLDAEGDVATCGHQFYMLSLWMWIVQD